MLVFVFDMVCFGVPFFDVDSVLVSGRKIAGIRSICVFCVFCRDKIFRV